MLLPILALLVAPGDHAHLHPADADLYMCGPEAQTAFVATQEACLWRLMNDPEIAALMGEEIDLPGSILGAFGGAGLDDNTLAFLATSLNSASFSVSGLDEFEASPQLSGITLDEALSVLFEHEALVVLDFSTAEEARAIMALSTVVTSDLVVAAESSHESPAGTVKVTDYEIVPGDSAHGLWSAAWGSHIAVGLGRAGAPGLLARLNGGESLAGTDHWIRGAEAMREEGGAPYINYHHNLVGDPWYALAADEAELPVPDILFSGIELFFGGLIPMGASEKHGSCRIVNGEYVHEIMDFGRAAAESTAPLSDDFLNLVNPEAVGVWSTTMEVGAVARTGHELIAELLGLPVDVVASELEYSVGASLEEFLAPLEKGVAFYMLPISGATIPRFHAVVQLEDPVAYEEAWTKLSEFLKNQGAEYVEVQDRPYRKTPVFTLKPVSQAGPVTDPNSPFAAVSSMGLANPTLTVAILPDRAVFGISASYVKRELRRLLKEADAETAAHPLAESGAPCPAGVNYFGHLDWPEVVGGVYDTVTAFLPLIADAGAMPFDIDAMPETETITQYFSSTDVWSRAGESGTYTLKRSPFGPETGLLLGAAVTAGVFMGRSGELVLGGDAPGASEEPTLPVSAPVTPDTSAEDEARSETRRRLQEVKIGLVVYKGDKGGFPGALSDLLVPTSTYPRGFLNSDDLPTDGWGNPLRYSIQAEGGGYRLWSSGPDGVDNGGDGDDLSSP